MPNWEGGWTPARLDALIERFPGMEPSEVLAELHQLREALRWDIEAYRHDYENLEETYHAILGVDLNGQEFYDRWAESLHANLLLVPKTDGGTIERLKADMVRRFDDYRARTKWRRTRGRTVGALSYTPQYRAETLRRYLGKRHSGVSQVDAAGAFGHSVKTLRDWAVELGINFI